MMQAGLADEPAIDLAAGVERVMGDHGIFRRVLARFGTEYKGAAGAIGAAVASGDAVLAQRLAHTLKGASGMIGAHGLQRQAMALEQALREEKGDCSAELGGLEAELGRVLREADSFCEPTR